MYPLGDTLCAVATPPGRGGVGIVRVSGPRALEFARALFLGRFPEGRGMAFGVFRDPLSGEMLDEGILLCMPGPESYTGEDVAELQAHGSPAVLERLIEALVRLGARPAQRGEFTYRAFRNSRLDLSRAEAVEALVGAGGDAARRAALRQLTGGLASHLSPVEESLKDLYRAVEARLEFSEEGLPPLDHSAFQKSLKEASRALSTLLESYGRGRVLREGLVAVLAGPPNAGKSSLLNALLGNERAIVAPQPGTTRDMVEGELLLSGVRVRLFDTAGFREAGDAVEAEGVRRSRRALAEADVVLWLVDLTAPEAGFSAFREAAPDPERTFLLLNKRDLADPAAARKGAEALLPAARVRALSCTTGEGVEEVLVLLSEAAAAGGGSGEDVVLTNARHRKEVAEAQACLERAQALLAEEAALEILAEELKGAALALGRIRGENLTEDAFQEIFSRFCIGK